jgi:hypothetical protein
MKAQCSSRTCGWVVCPWGALGRVPLEAMLTLGLAQEALTWAWPA